MPTKDMTQPGSYQPINTVNTFTDVHLRAHTKQQTKEENVANYTTSKTSDV